MKGLLLAVVMSVVCVAIVTLGFRMRDIQRRAAFMVHIFLATLPLFVVIHVASPSDLGILPVGLSDASPRLDLAFGLLVYLAGFFGGILQLYNLADRGFSLRMLIDIDESPRGALSAGDVARAYGGGRGIGWMYQKRLDGLLEHGLIRVEGGTVETSPRGRRVARVLGRLMSFLRLDAAA